MAKDLRSPFLQVVLEKDVIPLACWYREAIQFFSQGVGFPFLDFGLPPVVKHRPKPDRLIPVPGVQGATFFGNRMDNEVDTVLALIEARVPV